MKYIEKEIHDEERAYYHSISTVFNNIAIDGPTDGESAFKECIEIAVNNSKLCLRYPFWHNHKSIYNNLLLLETARAPFWYDKFITLESVICNGIKALRECRHVNVVKSKFISPEIFWKCKHILVKDSEIDSMYAFFGSKRISLYNLKFSGKYSFQYCKDILIENSNLNTKDAFWHSKNIVVKNSTVKGEYLGWYSKNLTFINCKIIGTQPLCYAKNIKFINCVMEGCDFSFEYSTVKGVINSDVVSIKNPKKANLFIKGKYTMITDGSKYKRKPRYHINNK